MSTLTLYPDQQQVVDDIAAAFRAGHKRIMVSAACGFGKCHARGTIVLMADGSRKAVEDVAVGDRLLSPTGGPRTVLSLGRGRSPMYRITPKKGEPYVVNEAHILSLRLSGSRRLRLADGRMASPGEVVALDVLTFLRSGKTAREYLKGWRPAAIDIESTGESLTVPPYILGAWLGDGRASGAELSKPECKMTQAFSAWGHELGCQTRRDVHQSRCQQMRLVTARGQENPALEALRGLGVIDNKHIPRRYLTASKQDRLALLAGLLDSDGHHVQGCYDWISSSESMARDFAFLARSLGFACYLTQCRKGIASTGFSGNYWRCSISGNTQSIPCLDKPAAPRRINKNWLVTGIKVEPIGVDEYYGFELDGDHLYLLEDFTVCHNTELATAILRATRDNARRGAFIADRRALVEQTSERFDKYDLPHGILMADHYRFKPSEQIQVCSAQTLARRRWPDVNLVVVDEAHILSETVKQKLAQKDCYAIGLSATAITKGLGKHFDYVVNAPTTNRLIEQNRLVPLKIYACAEPDMEGVAVKSSGEWDDKETEKKALEVVGDVVAEYLRFGEGKQFIGFAATIAHAEELQRQFQAAGINVATYTANDQPEDRSEIVQEFRKPHSSIRGILSVEALTRGFDAAHVEVLILARPLRKAVHVFVQMLGRVMRTSPATGKTCAKVLDHSGNVARFWNDWNDLFENGVTELDDGKKREKAKPKKKESEPVKCPECRALHKPAPVCPCCGHEYPPRQAITHVPGTLKEIVASGDRGLMRRKLWPEVCWFVANERHPRDNTHAQRMAQAIFYDLTGGPASARFETTDPVPTSREVRDRIRAQTARWAISRKKAARAAA